MVQHFSTLGYQVKKLQILTVFLIFRSLHNTVRDAS